MTEARPDAAPGERPKKIACRLTMIVAGLFGGLAMYLQWRQFGVPLELSVPVHLGDDGPLVRPWAPWWVPVSIVAGLTMLLWHWLVLRRQRISLWRAVVAMVLVSFLPPLVGVFSLEIGAVLQYSPPPSVFRIVSLMPVVLSEAIGLAVLMSSLGGVFLWPIYGLAGLLTAAAGRGVLRLLAASR